MTSSSANDVSARAKETIKELQVLRTEAQTLDKNGDLAASAELKTAIESMRNELGISASDAEQADRLTQQEQNGCQWCTACGGV